MSPLIDEQLSADIDALLRLVSLGSAARNTVKIKVRQPLAELKVRPGADSDRRAVERFADQIREELNVKKVTLHEGNGPLLSVEVKPNLKTLGQTFGPRLEGSAGRHPPGRCEALAAQVRADQPIELALASGAVTLQPADLWVSTKVPEGWAGVDDRGTQVLVDVRITAELKREGTARDVIRQVNQLRKEAGLEMEDRIILYLGTESATLDQAIDAHRDYIAAETLTMRWSEEHLGDGAATANVKVDGQALTIHLRKTGP